MTVEDLTGEIPQLMSTAVEQWLPMNLEHDRAAAERWGTPAVEMPRSTRHTWEHQSAPAYGPERMHWTVTPPLDEVWDDFVTGTSQLPYERLLPYPEPARLATVDELMMLAEYQADREVPKWPSYVLTLLTGVAIGLGLASWLLASC
jgi:hypothetical protein